MSFHRRRCRERVGHEAELSSHAVKVGCACVSNDERSAAEPVSASLKAVLGGIDGGVFHPVTKHCESRLSTIIDSEDRALSASLSRFLIRGVTRYRARGAARDFDFAD